MSGYFDQSARSMKSRRVVTMITPHWDTEILSREKKEQFILHNPYRFCCSSFSTDKFNSLYD